VKSILENMGYKSIRKEMKIKQKTGMVWAKEGYSDEEIRELFENADFGE
jgi:methionine salvage enolase-phosphatase E1